MTFVLLLKIYNSRGKVQGGIIYVLTCPSGDLDSILVGLARRVVTFWKFYTGQSAVICLNPMNIGKFYFNLRPALTPLISMEFSLIYIGVRWVSSPIVLSDFSELLKYLTELYLPCKSHIGTTRLCIHHKTDHTVNTISITLSFSNPSLTAD